MVAGWLARWRVACFDFGFNGFSYSKVFNDGWRTDMHLAFSLVFNGFPKMSSGGWLVG